VVTREDLMLELDKLDGQFVGVAFRPTQAWFGSVLHAQGKIRRDFVDQPPDGVAFGIGAARRRNGDWAEFEIIWADVESAAWRRDLLPNGNPVLAVMMRGGALLTIAAAP
jgi:hypothetical protein